MIVQFLVVMVGKVAVQQLDISANVYYGKYSKNRSFNVYMFFVIAQNDLYFIEPYKMVNSTPEAHAIDQTL